MMLIEKLAEVRYDRKSAKKLKNSRRWLDAGKDKDSQIDPDGQSRRGFEGKGGGFGERMGENTGGITYGSSGGYRPKT